MDWDNIDLAIELTRWCNMECSHCMRGNRQKSRMKMDYVNTMFDKKKQFSSIIFTGGEPTLALDLWDQIYDEIMWRHVQYGSFYVATNGLVTSRKFKKLLVKYFENTDREIEMNGLRISIDRYHDRHDNKRIFESWFNEDNWIYGETNLASLAHLELDGAPSNPEFLFDLGRASYNHGGSKKMHHSLELLLSSNDDYDDQVTGTMYLTTKGYLYSTCDISFEEEDNPESEFRICHVTDDIEAELEKFFERNPKLVSE